MSAVATHTVPGDAIIRGTIHIIPRDIIRGPMRPAITVRAITTLITTPSIMGGLITIAAITATVTLAALIGVSGVTIGAIIEPGLAGLRANPRAGRRKPAAELEGHFTVR
jgi:hypothetical protein